MKFVSRNDIVDYILAGDGLYIYEPSNRSVYTCSAGFWATNQFHTSISYIVTAGHCFKQDASYWYLPWNSSEENAKYYIGKMIVHTLSPADFGLIVMNGNITPIANIRNTDSREYPQLRIKDHIVVSSNGAHLCISGLNSHVKCGYVNALSGFASTIDRKDYIENIFVVNMYALKGDSGGPVFSYNQDLTHVSLNGILLGSFDYDINGDIKNAILQVTPIDFILNDTPINVVTVT
ncbi:streptogrisin [Gigaspora margarita]|uniref:Streptogrisin n=1 Tax=Gigaspora margarita TaxID=4874 RepID=A0A8H3X180_GIGMA|nr:streptogrisin [Gigaspora margarita]